jgi:hypothetical protein
MGMALEVQWHAQELGCSSSDLDNVEYPQFATTLSARTAGAVFLHAPLRELEAKAHGYGVAPSSAIISLLPSFQQTPHHFVDIETVERINPLPIPLLLDISIHRALTPLFFLCTNAGPFQVTTRIQQNNLEDHTKVTTIIQLTWTGIFERLTDHKARENLIVRLI